MIAAVVFLIAVAGAAGTAALLLGALLGAAVTLAALYNALLHRGVLRWASFVVAVLAPLVVLIWFMSANLVWVAVVSYALAGIGTACGRMALRPLGEAAMPEHPAPAPRHPFIVMNPRSGGGKVARFDLVGRAEELGAEVVLLDGSEHVDVAALAAGAVQRGADLLGVAGGDGTQALVAQVAATHDVPFLVISAGTRNHFALDLGLDRADPATCLDALRDGVELQVDLGRIGHRIFVNNASFGVYAEIVRSPAYRDDKAGTMLRLMPDLLSGHRGARLTARFDGTTATGPQAVLISNNPYGTNDIAGMGRRTRLDRGLLGIVSVHVASTRAAVGLLSRAHNRGLVASTATDVVIDADAEEIAVGVDGESLMMTTPVHCTILPGALRVRVPRDRPGVPSPKPKLDVPRLYHLAFRHRGR